MISNNSQPLSIFDLDRTLTIRGTWSPFLLFAARRLAPWRLAFVPVIILTMALYKARLMSRKQLKERMQALMLGRRISQARAFELAERFAFDCMANNIYAEGQELVRAEQAKGRRVVIASAAHDFYLGMIARRLGAEYIGTKSIWRDGMLLAEIEGDNCYGGAKLDRIVQFMDQNGIDQRNAHVRFFSDDISDLPTFDWADEAIAVNPSSRLARHATRQGWCIFNWRKPSGTRASASADDQLVKQVEIGLRRLSHAVPVGELHG